MNGLLSQINWLAVLVAAAAYFILGAIWYSKALFAPSWARLVGIDMNNPNKGKSIGGMMLTSFLLIVIIVIGQELLADRLWLTGWASGIKLGLITGLCFSTTAVSISFIYESRPTALYFIDCGYHVVGQLASAIILVMWR